MEKLDKRPIFVGGCDRSGTTLLASMVGGHSDVNCLPEAQFIARYAGAQRDISSVAADVLEHRRFGLWQMPVSQEDREDILASQDYATLIHKIASLYGRHHNRPEQRIWLDHAPNCIMSVEALLRVFPDAKFIHLVRDGRAVAASWLGMDWGPRHITTVADTWALRLAAGMAAEAKYPESVIRLKYENVVTAPEQEMERLSDFLGISFEEDMLLARGLVLPSRSASTHKLLKENGKTGVSISALDKWKTTLTQRQIELFEHRTGDLLGLVGYDLLHTEPRAPSKRESVDVLWQEFSGRARNLLKKKKRQSL